MPERQLQDALPPALGLCEWYACYFRLVNPLPNTLNPNPNPRVQMHSVCICHAGALARSVTRRTMPAATLRWCPSGRRSAPAACRRLWQMGTCEMLTAEQVLTFWA